MDLYYYVPSFFFIYKYVFDCRVRLMIMQKAMKNENTDKQINRIRKYSKRSRRQKTMKGKKRKHRRTKRKQYWYTSGSFSLNCHFFLYIVYKSKSNLSINMQKMPALFLLYFYTWHYFQINSVQKKKKKKRRL